MGGGTDNHKVIDVFGWPKSILLLIFVLSAIGAPSLLSRIRILSSWDPAWFALLAGTIVTIISFVTFMLFFRDDLDHRSMMSTVVVLGLISAHVSVFEISDELPHMPVFFLFSFLFYYHFTSLEVFKKH